MLPLLFLQFSQSLVVPRRDLGRRLRIDLLKCSESSLACARPAMPQCNFLERGCDFGCIRSGLDERTHVLRPGDPLLLVCFGIVLGMREAVAVLRGCSFMLTPHRQ